MKQVHRTQCFITFGQMEIYPYKIWPQSKTYKLQIFTDFQIFERLTGGRERGAN